MSHIGSTKYVNLQTDKNFLQICQSPMTGCYQKFPREIMNENKSMNVLACLRTSYKTSIVTLK